MCKNLSCSTRPQRRQCRGSASTVSTLLIVLLPKCPFCILSYSSAIALCGSAETLHSGRETGFWLTLVWAVLTLVTVLYNYKGKKTLYSFGVSALGIGCIVGPTLLGQDNPSLFIMGGILLLIGVWLNGSYSYFYRKILLPIYKRLIDKPLTFVRFFTS